MAKPTSLRFSAIAQNIVTNIVSGDAVQVSGREYMNWGEDNTFPQYVARLRDNVPSLSSIISGFADYICGDDVILNYTLVEGHPNWVDRKGTTINDLVRGFAEDLATFNGFVPEVIRNNGGGISEIKRLPIVRVRTDKDVQSIHYSEAWGDKYNRKKNIVVLPIFKEDSALDDSALDDSALLVKADTYGVYPQPTCAPALIACELERSIDEYHLNNINNAFTGSFIVNFNNGVPTQEEMDEVERTFDAKFTGKDNAGRCIFIWNDSIANRTTLEPLRTEDFGEKYKALAERSRQQIFTAFRASPNLFGIPTASGFNNEEYEASFRLFNRTMVRPMQRLICDTFDRILGTKGALTIKPFSLGDTSDDEQTEKTVE